MERMEKLMHVLLYKGIEQDVKLTASAMKKYA